MEPVVERALVFTDIVDSTALDARLGEAAARAIWAAHDRQARDLVARHGGREIDRTDGFFLLFESVGDAVGFALAYHAALAGLSLAARVGVHAGAVTLRASEPEDVRRGAKPLEVDGAAKPLAARIMSLALGGQTLLSAAARLALGARLPPGWSAESHGHYRLKGIPAPVEVWEIAAEGRAPVPPADAEKAYRVVASDTGWMPARRIPNNLPAERDAFVGRGGELDELARRLDAGHRLVTVVGTGGIGKTRLVTRYGRGWLGDWPGGVHFCDLAEARSIDSLCFAVAVALDVPIGRGDPVLQIGHAIAGRGRCLVIFDNFEQLSAHADVIGRWFDQATEAGFLVTSRERLKLAGEEVLDLEPLPLGDAAIELFLARAQRPGLAADAGQRRQVAEVVRLLDGLPLSIELAAARAHLLSPEQLVERLRDRFRVLGGDATIAGRRRALRAAIDWSWELLTPAEQATFAQCSVFEGGFTLAAAEAVVSLKGRAAPSVMDTVQALLDKSLLRRMKAPDPERFGIDEPYFGMFVSLHEYARDKLRGRARGAAQDRHAKYFAGLGGEAALEALHRSGGSRRLQMLGQELDNLVAACRHALGRGDVPRAIDAYRAAWEVLELRGPFTLGMELGRALLAAPGLDERQRALVLLTSGSAARRAGLAERAGAELAEAVRLAREIGDPPLQAAASLGHGTYLAELSRVGEASAVLEEALALCRQVGDRRREGIALSMLAGLHSERGGLKTAVAELEAALERLREVGDRRAESVAMGNLGMVHYQAGDDDLATALLEQAVEAARDVGDRRSEGIQVGYLGSLKAARNEIDDAVATYRRALTIARETGNRRHEGWTLGELGHLCVDERRFGEAGRYLREALAVHRDTGDGRMEGATLVYLGYSATEEGRFEAAREAFAAAASLLADAGDQMGLGKLAVFRGRLALREGDAEAAAAALAAADRAIAELELGSESALVQDADELRSALPPARTDPTRGPSP